jgi:hypothetical protein
LEQIGRHGELRFTSAWRNTARHDCSVARVLKREGIQPWQLPAVFCNKLSYITMTSTFHMPFTFLVTKFKYLNAYLTRR